MQLVAQISFIQTIFRWVLSCSIAVGALVCSLVLSQKALAAVNVKAEIAGARVVAGEPVILRITATSDSSVSIDDVKFSPPRGFHFGNEDGESMGAQQSVNHVSESFRTIINNGQFTTLVTRDYMLIPDKPGRLVIDPISVVANGSPVRTQMLAVNVLPAGATGPRGNTAQNPRGGIDPRDLLDADDPDEVFSKLLQRHGAMGGFRAEIKNPNEAYHIIVEVDKTKAYVGEQITASWYLLTRGAIRSFDPLKYPQLKGFWKEDIEVATTLHFQSEVVNGEPYQKALLMRSALFPIKEGNIIIDPYKTKATVLVNGGVFGGMGFGQPYVFNKASQEVKIQALPLPTENRPNDFTGAVGQFQLTAAVNTTQIINNQPFEYKLRIQGEGNAKSVALPPLNLPPGLELYNEKSDSKFNPDGTSFKDFTLFLIPRQTGNMTVPAVSMSYFDPKSKTYVRKSAPAVQILVREGTGQNIAQAGSASTSANKTSAQLPMDHGPGLILEWQSPRKQTAQWPLWVAIYLLVGVGLLLQARRVGLLGKTDRQQYVHRQLQRRFKEIKTMAEQGEWRKVGVTGTNLIYFVLGELSEQGGSGREIELMLEKIPPSLRAEFREQIEKLLGELEILSFAPESYSEARRSKEHLLKVAKELEKCLARSIKIFSGEPSAQMSSSS